MLTEEDIEMLINEEKRITIPPKKDFVFEKQHKRKDFDLVGTKSENSYRVFVRCHQIFQENFSVGLIYRPVNERQITLIRMNGKHGHSNNRLSHVSDAHYDFHVHKITSEAIELEISEPPKKEITDKYVSFEQAITYFCSIVNIKDFQEHFPIVEQLGLFDA